MNKRCHITWPNGTCLRSTRNRLASIEYPIFPLHLHSMRTVLRRTLSVSLNWIILVRYSGTVNFSLLMMLSTYRRSTIAIASNARFIGWMTRALNFEENSGESISLPETKLVRQHVIWEVLTHSVRQFPLTRPVYQTPKEALNVTLICKLHPTRKYRKSWNKNS